RFWILDWVVAIVRSPSSLVREPKSETQPSPTGRGWRSRSRGRAGCGVTWLCRPIRSLHAVQVTPHPARVPHARDRGPLPLGEGKDPIPSCSPRERGQMTKVGPPCPARDAGHAQLPIRDQRLRARGQSVQIAPRAVHEIHQIVSKKSSASSFLEQAVKQRQGRNVVYSLRPRTPQKPGPGGRSKCQKDRHSYEPHLTALPLAFPRGVDGSRMGSVASAASAPGAADLARGTL